MLILKGVQGAIGSYFICKVHLLYQFHIADGISFAKEEIDAPEWSIQERKTSMLCASLVQSKVLHCHCPKNSVYQFPEFFCFLDNQLQVILDKPLIRGFQCTTLKNLYTSLQSEFLESRKKQIHMNFKSCRSTVSLSSEGDAICQYILISAHALVIGAC